MIRAAWPALVLLACGDGGCGGPAPVAPAPTPVDTGTPDPNHDPLSMPATPTLSLDDFNSAAVCQDCHPTHHAQWSMSNHAYAMEDPVYRALVMVRQHDLDGASDMFCTQCHSPIGTRSGDIQPGFSFESLDPLTLEGVNCDTCHKAQAVLRTHSSGLLIDGSGPTQGGFADPEPAEFHRPDGLEQADYLSESSTCGACHDAFELTGLPLERPYAEWTTSPAADESRPCQSCHMPTEEGIAAVGAATVRTLHDHRFIGVDIPLTEGFVDPEQEAEIREEVKALLGGAASLHLDLPEDVQAGQQLDVVLTIQNDIDAHNFPTGSTFLRQVWLEVRATDAAGTLLYETGTLDEDGDLMDHWSTAAPYADADLVIFHSGFVDAQGDPTLFTHRAAEHQSNALQPLHERTITLFVPTEDAVAGPIQVDARLRFRAFAPYLLRTLALEGLVDRLEIHDVDAVSGSVLLDGAG